MRKHLVMTSALGVVLAVQPITEAAAAIYAARNLRTAQVLKVEQIQYAPGVRVYNGWRGQPGWRGAAPAWRGPSGWAGRPYWYGRAWAPRSYYGTIFAGVALGTLVTVAAIGAVPPRPHPSLCWYWADPYGYRGYWDYC